MQDMTQSLPPGFRFHPTDEELITCYLMKKVASSADPTVSMIADADIYKFNPWELPGASHFPCLFISCSNVLMRNQFLQSISYAKMMIIVTNRHSCNFMHTLHVCNFQYSVLNDSFFCFGSSPSRTGLLWRE